MANPTIKGFNFQLGQSPRIKGFNLQTGVSGGAGVRVKAFNFSTVPTATLKAFEVEKAYYYIPPLYPKVMAFHVPDNLNYGWPKMGAIKFKYPYLVSPPNYPKLASIHFKNNYMPVVAGYPKTMAIKFFTLQGTTMGSTINLKSNSVIS